MKLVRRRPILGLAVSAVLTGSLLTVAAAPAPAAPAAAAPAPASPAAPAPAASAPAASAPAAPEPAATAAAPRLTASTFADPPATVRPKYRWWMPLAYTDNDELRAELADMKAAGAGGAEVAAFSVDGPDGKSPDFLAKYGWGTPLWTEKVDTMLAAAADLDLGLDLTIGPRWPAVVPTVSDLNDPRAAQQLVYSYEFAPGGSTRSGALPANLTPAPPKGATTTLVAALVARCQQADCDTQTSGSRMLDQGSVQVLTGQVSDGKLSVTFPGTATDTYALIAFYQTADGTSRSNLTATSPNYYLDYLSRQGAEATTDFYDSQILTPQVRQQIKQVGSVNLFEDSLELGSSQKWTWDFAQQWQQRRGYSPIPLLPALAGAGTQGLSAGTFFDFADGARIRTDYRQTWSDVYIDRRLKFLQQWTRANGMGLREQPYGGPVDTAEASRFVDIPEGESLAFNHNIEDYKLLAVGAHLNGNTMVSNECCATREKVWATTAGGAEDPGNLQAVYRGFAGGVTQVVWHGYPYLTQGPDNVSASTRWPGMTYGGNTSFAEAWGAKGGPNWADYKQVNDNVARLQLVLRQGKPRFDVAVYWQDFGMTGHGTTGSGSNTLLSSRSALARQGYTYDYVSPASLRGDDASVSNGTLFPQSSAYRAMLLKDQSTMPLDTAQRLLSFARSGLKVVVIGDFPSHTPGLDPTGVKDRRLAAVMTQLRRTPGVIRVGSESEVPAALARLKVPAAAAHRAIDRPGAATPGKPGQGTASGASSDIVSVRRQDSGTNYYYLFNQSTSTAEQQITLTGSGVPYRLNTWTGEITPITDYQRSGGKVTVDVRLEAADATVIAVTARRDDTFPGAGHPGHQVTTARNDGSVSQIALDDWTLATESWTAGPSDLAGDTSKTALPSVQLTAADDGTLPPWSAVTTDAGYPVDLADVSGIGTYTSTFTVGSSWQGVRRSYLDLGSAVDTVRVAVNGTQLDPVDLQDLHHIDIGDRIRPGRNTVTVRVASTLLNAVRVAPGTGAAGRERMDYGLLGPVTLTPVDAKQPTLTVEALDRRLPLAAGGTNQARIRIHNGASKTVQVTLTATTGDGVSADLPARKVRIPADSFVTETVLLHGDRTDGSSRVTIGVDGSNGTSGSAEVLLSHSDNLALNTVGARYPQAFASSNQDRYPASFATDGQASTFWVSGGNVPGQGPTATDPAEIGVDLGDPTSLMAIGQSGRSSYGPRDYQVQTSLDGSAWTTVATVTDAPKTGQVTQFARTTARYVRLHVTRGWYTSEPGNNTQLGELSVYAKVDNLAKLATAGASSTHSKFSVAAVNDGSIAGQHDYAVWNAGNGWNDADKATWPDTLTLTWSEPVTLTQARVFTVDNGTNPASGYGLRDYDVQALVDGSWSTLAQVRGNTDGTVVSDFPPVTTGALRLLITDSNDHGYSRVVEFEARG
ncbi:glycosyl hydrolase [Nakamurella lactea]|uniref:glycosyl hydrolase n=1 Tax=Nakamurella lactea TaxID=459515 RepID=UPI0003FD6D32|nr:glycosyl hydrolase [Nakamurella lactea]